MRPFYALSENNVNVFHLKRSTKIHTQTPSRNDYTNDNNKCLQSYSVVAADALLKIGMAVI